MPSAESAKSEAVPGRIIADRFKIAIVLRRPRLWITNSWIVFVSLFFATVVHADIVVGFACPLRMSCDAGVIVIAT